MNEQAQEAFDTFLDEHEEAQELVNRMNRVINIARSHLLMAKRGPDPNGIVALESAIADLDAYEIEAD